MAATDVDWSVAARGRRWSGIHEQPLYQWQRRLASSDAVTGPAVMFRELPAPSSQGGPRCLGISSVFESSTFSPPRSVSAHSAAVR
jgi:hypothetical protein